jgi:alanine racemase
MLYGASPMFPGRGAADLGLTPAMTLHSRLLSIRELAAGEAVGYGASWRTPEAMRVGIAMAGYADGYPRHAPSGTPVLLSGRRAQLAGRVSMDLICIDLRGHDDAREGDEVVLWGEGLPADEVAHPSGTVAYQLFCCVTRRVPFEYREG